MIVYYKLWDYMTRKGMKRSDLYAVTTPATVSKLGKNESVTTELLGRICKFLQCQPGDIMEYEDD